MNCESAADPGCSRDVAETAPEIRETHTGIVVLVGDRAYEGKKPVVTDFLDFSTVQRRELACQRELRLNFRLAGESYLGVAHLTDPGGGQPEPVVVMRRYPDSLRLASMVQRGEEVEAHLSAIAERVARFHREADRSPTVGACAIKERVENLAELDRWAGTVLAPETRAEVRRLALQFIDGRHALFADPGDDDRIVDGRGDLIAEDVFCPSDGPVLLDCLEFDDELRYLDSLDDTAFLAMDLEFLGSQEHGEFFLKEYGRLAADPASDALAHFYIADSGVYNAGLYTPDKVYAAVLLRATPHIASAMIDDQTPWPEAHRIDTSRPLSDSVAEARQACCLAI